MVSNVFLKVFSLLCLFFAVFIDAERTCDTVIEGCSCRDSSTNKIVSLEKLIANMTDEKPRFETNLIAHWKFAFSPCTTFDMFLDQPDTRPGYYGCKSSTAARLTTNSVNQCMGLGDLKGSKFNVNENFTYPIMSNLTLTYRNQTTKQGAVISLICDLSLNATNSQFQYVNTTEGTQETFYLTLKSPCACPGECLATIPTPIPSSAVMSTLNVMLLLVTLYLAVLLL